MNSSFLSLLKTNYSLIIQCQTSFSTLLLFILIQYLSFHLILITPVFLPGEFHGQRSLQATVHKITKSWTPLNNVFQRNSQMLRIHRLVLAPVTWNFKMIVEMKRIKKNFDNINNYNPFKEKYSLECIFCAKHYSGWNSGERQITSLSKLTF